MMPSHFTLTRRDFVSMLGVGLTTSMFPIESAFAGPFVLKDFARLIPADKKLKLDWVESLTAPGEPEVFTGEELRFIGMPVGGLFAGTLYLGGDGRLWLWHIFNQPGEGVTPQVIQYAGRRVRPRDGSNYVSPPQQQGPVDQGFVLRVESNGQTISRRLDQDHFEMVTFKGQYPVGTVTYSDPAIPVEVQLEAFSPFVPLDARESSLPATILQWTLTNTSDSDANVTLSGWLQNAVGFQTLAKYPEGFSRNNRIIDEQGITLLECTTTPEQRTEPRRPDIIVEDWNREDFGTWQVQGTAFGAAPIAKQDMPAYQGDLGGPTARVVNSHASAPGGHVAEKDAATGMLTSEPFQIERRLIQVWIGGGRHPGGTCVNLVVEGRVVGSVTGRNDNRMMPQIIDAGAYQGRDAVLQIVDSVEGDWGNVGVGEIRQTDEAQPPLDLLEAYDMGEMSLALLGEPAEVRLAAAEPGQSDGRRADQVTADPRQKLVGTLGRKLTLPPGASATVRFVIAWRFANLDIGSNDGLTGRSYATRFASATDVARYVNSHFDRLAGDTFKWRDTWYDSTLPYWFLNRTFANTSILATTTCYQVADGRFWAWEGIGCCPGTCTHVWHYAQALGRIFPEIERDQRRRVDFGLALDLNTGIIGFRGQHGHHYAIDGQCGRILGAYREHQTSPDNQFLNETWHRIKRAMQCVIDTDAHKRRDGRADGILHGPLHNTLDANWYGVVPWINNLYHVTLRAAEEMAREVGDDAFARQCRDIFERGRLRLDDMTYKDDWGYFVHLGDEQHPNEVGAYEGCHIDQVLGDSWSHQVALGAIGNPPHVRRALESLWTFNFTPDVEAFRAVRTGGRWYAMPGDGGMIMVSFPFVPERTIQGGGAWTTIYFNECMSGFEWQVAGHMIAEGMLTEGLAIARAIHDRYHPRLRNPYNEVECSDHYARAMASYGAFITACGFEYHGPKGHIGFAPRIRPEDFKAPFTAAEGWGSFDQQRDQTSLRAGLTLRHGHLRLRSVGLQCADGMMPRQANVRLDDQPMPAKLQVDGSRVTLALESEVIITKDQRLTLNVT